MTSPLSTLFLESAPAPGFEPPDRERLEIALTDAANRGSAAWPGVSVDAAAFAQFLGERSPAGADPLQTLSELRIEELYLCCACLSGSSAAINELDRRFIADSGRALGRFRNDSQAREEALQHAREKLLTGGADAPPKLAQYSGRGALGGWIRVVVVRTALNTQRAEKRHVPRDDDLLATRIAEDSADPELRVMKAEYADTLAQAVAGAFRRLTSEQRNLLRMYVIDELSLAELGRLHSVDASTISRWLTKIRGRLLEDAQNELLERHALRPSECASVMRLVRSDLHLSIARLLQTEPAGTVEV
ncbi:MAG: sigma-70 family RNA polymerase sigma factor [Myxococcales bacterium]|nr:sigma-70 family RNA polymerase sigma factor [Myxococcales bacterium]